MSDLTQLEERFRMANPVPDPADPPMTVLTAPTALLEIDERRGTMETKERPAPTPASPARSRRWVAAGVAFAVVVAAVGLGFLLNRGEGPGPATSPDTTLFTGTPTVTFDGTSCVYQGPSEFTLGQPRTFRFVNASPDRFRGSSSKLFTDGLTPAQIESRPFDSQMTVNLGRDIDAGATVEFSGAPGAPVPDEAGTWALTCDPVWPNDGFSGVAATYEVIPPEQASIPEP